MTVIPPISLREQIIHLSHEGHSGISRTKTRVRDHYWWPGIANAVEKIVRKCINCECADKSKRTFNPPLGVGKSPDLPWQDLALDIMGPINWVDNSFKYIIVLVDLFSRWFEFKIVERVDTSSVIDFFFF